MAVLVQGRTPRDLAPTDRLPLDRDLLSDGRDRELSRAVNAPLLRAMDGRWWLINHNGAELSVYVTAEGRRFAVGERCAFPFPPGSSTIILGRHGYQIQVVVDGDGTKPPGPARPGDTTEPATLGADERVQQLFRDKHRHKVVLAAYYRNYFQPGVDAPAPLGRDVTRLCLGIDSYTALEKALNEVSTAIWGRTSGTRHMLPMFLIRRGLLIQADQDLVPHKKCNHGRRSVPDDS